MEGRRVSGAPLLWVSCAAAVVALAAIVLSSRPAAEAHAPPPAPAPLATSTPTPDSELAPPRKVDIVSGPNRLTGYLFVPAGGARAPVIVYNHGSEQDPDLRFLGEVGRFYQARGFAVLFPWRQGCSGSGGTYWLERFPMTEDESDPHVLEARTIRALRSELVDVLAAVDFARTLPEVDPAHVIVSGSSFGGLLSLMAASSGAPIQAAVVCSGAAWTYNGSTDKGQEELEAIGRAAKVPVFLLQAQNDYNPTASDDLGAALGGAHVRVQALTYPKWGTTNFQGHAGFCNHGMPVWGEDALAFLRLAMH